MCSPLLKGTVPATSQHVHQFHGNQSIERVCSGPGTDPSYAQVDLGNSNRPHASMRAAAGSNQFQSRAFDSMNGGRRLGVQHLKYNSLCPNEWPADVHRQPRSHQSKACQQKDPQANDALQNPTLQQPARTMTSYACTRSLTNILEQPPWDPHT